MKILQLVLHEGVGGMETVAATLHEGLSLRGHIVVTAALDEGAVHASERTSRVRRLRRLAGLYHQHRTDVVLSHSAIPTVYARLMPWRIPLVSVVHSLGFDLMAPPLKRAERILGWRSRATVFVSRTALANYRVSFPRRGGELHHVYNGVGLSQEDLPDRHWPPRRILTVSRLTPSKDLGTAVIAFGRYLQEYPTATLTIVGDAASPDYERSLRSLVEDDAMVAKATSFLGRRGDVEQLMRESDLLLHPSHHEAQSVVLGEASVQGLPFICSTDVYDGISWPCGAIPFEFGNADSLLSAIRLIAAQDDLPRVARDAAGSAREILDPAQMVANYERILTLASQRARGSSNP
jgi:L-malate glycosyltransferase